MRKMKEAKKTMVYLDETVHRLVRYTALTRRISMAEFIRQAVDEKLKRHETRKAVRK